MGKRALGGAVVIVLVTLALPAWGEAGSSSSRGRSKSSRPWQVDLAVPMTLHTWGRLIESDTKHWSSFSASAVRIAAMWQLNNRFSLGTCFEAMRADYGRDWGDPDDPDPGSSGSSGDPGDELAFGVAMAVTWPRGRRFVHRLAIDLSMAIITEQFSRSGFGVRLFLGYQFDVQLISNETVNAGLLLRAGFANQIIAIPDYDVLWGLRPVVVIGGYLGRR